MSESSLLGFGIRHCRFFLPLGLPWGQQQKYVRALRVSIQKGTCTGPGRAEVLTRQNAIQNDVIIVQYILTLSVSGLPV